MASKIIVLCATLAFANAGIIAHNSLSPAITYAAAPVAKYATYSSAPAVSSVYSSIASPTHISYAAPKAALAYSYAPAHVSYSSPAVGASSQSTVRSFDGTVSQYAKAVDTAFSSVRKQDTRITNSVYAAAAPTIYAHAAAAPTIYAHAAPAVYARATPAVYAHAAPAVYAHAAPAVYAHSAPAVVATKSLTYSASPVVAHVTFDGLGAHYNW